MDSLDKFVEYLEEIIPDTTYLTKNKKRYDEVKEAIQQIADFAWGVDESADIDVKPDEITGTCMLMTIRTNIFIVDEMDKFCKALQKADTIDAAALDDGRISLGLTFENVFELLPPPGTHNDKA